jgi:protein ImuA
MISPAASTLAALRRSLASLEEARLPRTRFPDDGILNACTGVTMTAALHEVAASRESALVAASGFVLPLAAGAASKRATLWIAEEIALAENGALYGPGLDAFGLPPERLVRVAVARERDVLWAMEEGLRCRGVGAVIGEMRGTGRGIGLTASRRLSLAAERNGTVAFLLRAMPSDQPVAAATRWVVCTAPSSLTPHGPGPPRLDVRLTRNRRGSVGSWLLEWNSVDQRFQVIPADRQSLAGASFDRPARAAAGGA